MPDEKPAPESDPEVDQVDVETIEHEREERLAAENRPDNVEVDNTQRDFDAEKGLYTDVEGYDDAPAPFPPPAEQDA